jgi:hypothetical protein
MSKVLRGNVTIWAVRPEAYTADEWSSDEESTFGLSVAKWNAAEEAGLITDASCAIEDGYSLNTTGTQTSSSRSVCDIAEVENPTFDEYEASLDLFRNKPGTIDTPIYDIALHLFDGLDVEYYLVKRVDKEQGAPVEAGDILSWFGVSTDYGVDITDDNSDLMYGARFKPNGVVRTNKTSVA